MPRLPAVLAALLLAPVAVALGAAGLGALPSLPVENPLGCGDAPWWAWSEVSTPGPYVALPQEHHTLRSHLDDAPIQVGLVRPDVPEGQRVPVIAVGSPYFQPLQTFDYTACIPHIVENFVPHGYAVALLPVRGTGDSGGCLGWFSPEQRADLDQAVTWLGRQAWSSGDVGMMGVSWAGSTPWMVASLGNPHLRTIVPMQGISDTFATTGHAQGNRDWPIHDAWFQMWEPYAVAKDANGRSVDNTVRLLACPSYAEKALAVQYAAATGRRDDPFGFWDGSNQRPGVEQNYRGSVLVTTGLRDAFPFVDQAYPWVHALEARGVLVKHLVGQWEHAAPDQGTRADWADVLLRWFDRFLKHNQDSDIGPRAEVEDTLGHWRSEAGWPPPDAAPARFFLAPGGALAADPSAEQGVEVLGPDPGRTYVNAVVVPVDLEPALGGLCADAPGCSWFAGEPMAQPFRFAGTPQVSARVTPLGPGGHLAAFLYVVSGEEAVRVGAGQVDLRYADGSGAPTPVVPGAPLQVQVRLSGQDVLVPEGSRLALVLSQGTARGVGFAGHMPSLPPSPLLLHTGGDASTVTLMAFEREDAP